MKQNHYYKAKSRETNEWIIGHLASIDLIAPDFPEEKSNALGKYYDELPYVGFVEVYENTVCKFIGVEDSKKNPVAENDFVQFTFRNHKRIHKVVWSEEKLAYVIGENVLHLCDFITLCEEFEVIGNAIDNPELCELEDKTLSIF